MKIQNKQVLTTKIITEIDLSIDNLRDIIVSHLNKEGISGKAWDFNFRVVNKPINSSIYPSDSIDRYEFDGVKVIVSK